MLWLPAVEAGAQAVLEWLDDSTLKRGDQESRGTGASVSTATRFDQSGTTGVLVCGQDIEGLQTVAEVRSIVMCRRLVFAALVSALCLISTALAQRVSSGT